LSAITPTDLANEWEDWIVTGGSASGIEMRLAGYRIDAVVGQGGMGTVYRAEQLRLQRDVALKVMAPHLASDPGFRERFLRESQIAASLEHPHVVTVYDAGEADGVLYIAMRYVPGGDLRGLIRRAHGLPAGVALSVLQQVAGGLDAAHELGLVHRDVKPSNVLIAGARRPDGSVQSYVTDFGLSKRIVEASDTDTRRPIGSVHYMSPEQIRGEQLDARSDTYSLGCLLYECLTGEVPYACDSEVAVLYAHLEARCPRVSSADADLPAALDDVLAWALAKAPAERPASSGELAAAVAEALRGSPVSRPPSPRPAPVTGAPAIHPSRPGGPRARPIVGRLEEQGQLLRALEQAVEGDGSVVLLVGEAGIGKSTLARQLSEQAERRGVPTLWATGGAFGAAPPPYWHWLQLVRALARRADGGELFGALGAAAAWLVAIAPEIATALPDIAPTAAPMGADEGRFHVYDALARLFVQAAGGSGLVIVLDDLHLADEASLLALAFIAAMIRDTGVLVVGTYREGDPAAARGGEEDSSLSELSRSSETIRLGALDSEHVGRLISERSGGQAPVGMVERVHDVTGGNPLFVTELLNLLETQGRLTDSKISSSALPLPRGISDAISQRLAPLAPRAREALDVGAVIGASFRAGTLARAAGIPPGESLELLDQAVAQGIVRPVAELADGYTFSHGLVQATLYEALPRTRRCAIHAAVGEALEKDYDITAGEGLAEVAYHFL
jgi:eukaryotic-like serine/threonine-protein kinase